jgi:hypothetical protein
LSVRFVIWVVDALHGEILGAGSVLALGLMNGGFAVTQLFRKTPRRADDRWHAPGP